MSDTNKIILLLGAIAGVVGLLAWMGQTGGKLSEKKGYSFILGFLMAFYFGPFGLLYLRRMEADPIGLRRRAVEDARLAGERVASPSVASVPWRYTYSGRRPVFPAVFAMLGVTLLVTLALQSRPEEMGGGGITLVNIPYERGDWACVKEDNSDSDLMQQIKADAYTMRHYVNKRTHQQVELYLVYRRYGRREFNHNPDQCFPAGGYRLLNRDTATMPYAGSSREVVHMVFDGSQVMRQDGQTGVPPATVCYFFASGAKTEFVFLKQQFWMAMERILPNKNGWTLIRLNSPRLTNDEDALAAQQDFMATLGPAIQQTITTDAVDTSGMQTASAQ